MRLFSRAVMVTVAVATLTGLAVSAAAQDWPQWRGPARDGVAAAFDVPASWPDALERHWTVEIGLGYAAPVLIGDRLYLFTRQGDDEVMTALDAATGETVWRTSYAAPFDMNPSTARHRAGPKSTPTFDNSRLFAHGMTGSVTAFRRRIRRAALALPRDRRRAAVPHLDVAARGRRPRHRPHRRARRRRPDGVRRCDPGRCAGAGTATGPPTARRCCSSSAAPGRWSSSRRSTSSACPSRPARSSGAGRSSRAP